MREHEARERFWDDLIAGIEEIPPEFENDEQPALDNEGDVDRLLRLRARAVRECDRIHDRFDDEIDRLCRIRDDLLAGEEKTISWVERSLQTFGRQLRAGGRKSLTLPHGSIKTRQSTKLVVDDEEGFIEWLREAGHVDLLRVKIEIDKVAVRKVLDDDEDGRLTVADDKGLIVTDGGEMLAGVKLDKASVSVSIES